MADCCQHFDGFVICKWPADAPIHTPPGVAHNIVPGRPERGQRFEYHEYQEERDERQYTMASLPHLIVQRAQRQDSLNDQLSDLVWVANRLGMYDAADFITRQLSTPERTS